VYCLVSLLFGVQVVIRFFSVTTFLKNKSFVVKSKLSLILGRCRCWKSIDACLKSKEVIVIDDSFRGNGVYDYVFRT